GTANKYRSGRAVLRRPRRRAPQLDYNLGRDAFELTNVAGKSVNAGLIAIMAARLRELDPGWTGSAPSAPASAAPPDYANDDAFESPPSAAEGGVDRADEPRL